MAHESRTHQGPHRDRAGPAGLAGRRAQWRLGAQAYDEYHVFVRVAEAGHYYVEFLAPLAQSEFTTDKVIPPDAKNWWGATRLEVKKRDTTPSPQ